MKTLLKSTTIVDKQSTYHLQCKDLLLEDGRILQIADSILSDADQVIDGAHLHLSPCWFDAGVSFGEPGFEEQETINNGLQVAEASGFGEVALVSSNHPCTDSINMVESLRAKSQHSKVGIHPIACLTKARNGQDLAELYDLYQAGARVFSDDLQPVKNPNLLKLALQYTQQFGGVVASFPIDQSLAQKAQVHESPTSTRMGLKGMPSIAETLQIQRDLAILRYAGGHLHIPLVSTAEGIACIAQAKKEGLSITCSVAVHHLFFEDRVLEEFDAKYKVFPPLRTKEDVTKLRKAVKNGVVDFITSDHRPINLERKKLDFYVADYGSIGLESAFGALNLLFGKELSVEMLTQGKAIYGIPSVSVEVEAKGKWTLFDPTIKYTFTTEHVLSKSKNSIFINESLQGKALQLL